MIDFFFARSGHDFLYPLALKWGFQALWDDIVSPRFAEESQMILFLRQFDQRFLICPECTFNFRFIPDIKWFPKGL
jgi:hypothetical protein